MLDPVIDILGLDATASGLAGSVTATSPKDTVLLNISVTRMDPSEASEIANAIANSLSDVAQVIDPGSDGSGTVVMTDSKVATPPLIPSSPNVQNYILLGIVFGIFIAIAQALLRHMLDLRLKTLDDIQRVSDLPVVGSIYFDGDASVHPLIVQEPRFSPRAESMRRLRTNLQFLGGSQDLKLLLVTSAVPGEGKTSTAMNLAITLADAGKKVLLVALTLEGRQSVKY